MIKLSNVTKIFNEGKLNQVKALNEINMSIFRGEMISIMGPSGCGKTTLLNIMGTIDKPSTGKITIDNIDVCKLDHKSLDKIRCNQLGYVFQDFNLINSLNVSENIELPLFIAGSDRKRRIERVNELISFIGLDSKKLTYPNKLSGGQKQRVAIARSLANNPKIILCDEPTGSLDWESGSQIMDLLIQINEVKKRTIIIVTHDPLVAEKTKKTYTLLDGNIDKIFQN